jgi:DnaJ-class molecular chaperone
VILIGLAFLITQSLKQIEENSHKMKTFNPYEELEVPETATPEEIKKAYKIMARKWHPDKNKQIEAKAKFILINKAYEVFL